MDQQNDGIGNLPQCDECGVNAANVHVTQISNNQATVFKLCEACAQKKGISISIGEAGAAEQPGEKKEPVKDIQCPVCKMKFIEFKEKGWLGCAACYEAFVQDIDAMLVQVHGSCVHQGKRYVRKRAPLRGRTDVKLLRGQLVAAVKNEEFELAAQLRDTINLQLAKDEKR